MLTAETSCGSTDGKGHDAGITQLQPRRAEPLQAGRRGRAEPEPGQAAIGHCRGRRRQRPGCARHRCHHAGGRARHHRRAIRGDFRADLGQRFVVFRQHGQVQHSRQLKQLRQLGYPRQLEQLLEFRQLERLRQLKRAERDALAVGILRLRPRDLRRVVTRRASACAPAVITMSNCSRPRGCREARDDGSGRARDGRRARAHDRAW